MQNHYKSHLTSPHLHDGGVFWLLVDCKDAFYMQLRLEMGFRKEGRKVRKLEMFPREMKKKLIF